MANADTIELHATLVDYLGRGILLRGPPGAGKSDLALRLVDGGAQLVADDRVILRRHKQGALMGRAPAALAGLLEVRGIGILPVNHKDEVSICVIVDLVRPEEVVRLPEPRAETLLGVAVPLLALAPFAPGAAAALKLAVTCGALAGWTA
jgi:serine kinase of HPr protein (carbohydrate metabolism regulator)